MPALFNTIRRVVDAFGGSPELASAVCTEVGDEFNAATYDRARELVGEEPPPTRLGHTELEAVMCWCPHVRDVTPVGKGPKDAAVGNRYIDRDGGEFHNPSGTACIASCCMMWRWLDPLRGYCGLAGKPECQPLGEPRIRTNRTPLLRPHESLAVGLLDGVLGE